MEINKIKLPKNLMLDRNFQVFFKNENLDKWNRIYSEITYIPFSYSSQSIDYQKAYQESAGNWVLDYSLVIFWDHKPAGIWPLSVIGKPDGSKTVGAFGSPIGFPLFVNSLAQSSRKKIIHFLLDLAEWIRGEYCCAGLEFVDFFCGSLAANDWVKILMDNGARCDVTWDLFLDLSLTIDDIRSVIRKSYKPLISKGSKLWKISVLCEGDFDTWNKFRELHCAVSGRVTRSDNTWEKQLLSIKDGSAFLIYLENQNGDMVGGGFFEHSKFEGTYSVGVYDRSLFDKPLGHVVQYQAILEMKARGINWYKVGSRCFSGEFSNPSSKESSIGEFKSGFCSSIFPRYWFKNINRRF